jgi:hypothetical protein
MADEIPPWALERATSLCNAEPQEQSVFDTPSVAIITSSPRFYPGYIAFARYIAEHEEPPVDPVDAEIQRITERTYDLLPGDFTRGARSVIEQGVAEAFRRGMELAREQSK